MASPSLHLPLQKIFPPSDDGFGMRMLQKYNLLQKEQNLTASFLGVVSKFKSYSMDCNCNDTKKNFGNLVGSS